MIRRLFVPALLTLWFQCSLYAQIPAGFTPMLNDTNLNGWTQKGNTSATWTYQAGILKMYQSLGGAAGWLQFNQQLTNFSFYCEWKSEAAGNSGIHWGITNSTVTPVWDANEIQLCDDPNYNLYYGKDGYIQGDKREQSGSIYGVVGVKNSVYAGTNNWNTMQVTVVGKSIELKYNGVVVYQIDKDDYPNDFYMWNTTQLALSKRPTTGFIGLQSHKAANMYFRNLAYKDLSTSPCASNIAPTINITAPANVTNMAIGSTVNVAATAGDTNGTVSKVEFLVDGTSIGVDNTTPYTASFTASKAIHTITAIATDNCHITTSQTITVYDNSSLASRSSLYEDSSLLLWVNNEGMTSQFVNDRSPNKLVGQNYKCLPTAGKYGNAAEYNHLDSSHINFGNQCNTENAVTIMAWVKLYSLGHDGKNMEVIEKEMMYWINYMTALDGDPEWVPYKNRFRAGMFVSTGPGYTKKQLIFINSKDKYFPNRDTWIHVAMTYDRQNIKLYINGVLDVMQAETRPIEQSAFDLCIGTKHAQDQYGVNNAPFLRQWDGVIDDALIFKRSLTDAEIAGYYTHTKKGVALSTTRMNVGSGASTQTFDVISNAPYTIASNQTWCTVNVTSDDEDRIVTVSATRNTGVQRTATITVTGAQTKTITVTQAATGARGSSEVLSTYNSHAPLLYPNPATEQIHFNFVADAQSATIINAQGATVDRVYTLKTKTLDVSRYAAGIYSLVVQTATGQYTERFVIE